MRSRFLSAVVLLFSVRAASAQRAPAMTLQSANARLPEEFSSIAGVRELADGRVLVSDERENRVVVADFTKGTVSLVGRTGAGPGEYRRAGVLFALPGDSTLMPQDMGGNWHLFAGAAAPALVTSEQSVGLSRFAMPGGFDMRGNALILTMKAASSGVQGRDSLDLVLHARASHREVEIGRARSPFGALPGQSATQSAPIAVRAGDGSAGRPTPMAFFLMDRALLFPDGWIAVARLQPYRVDWRAPDGKVIAGAAIAPPRAYDDADKRAYLEREAVTTGRPRRELDKVFGWPEFLPAFSGLSSPLIAAPDGKLWIGRTVSAADKGTRYDVVDRRGALTGVLTLRSNERVAGFGPASVYVVVTDDDGIQHLEKHPRP